MVDDDPLGAWWLWCIEAPRQIENVRLVGNGLSGDLFYGYGLWI
jgi:hypothetical protein